ncbi:MAG: glycogen/starch synthase [Deltaproteobacteria bacterium]|nr:glycogen/starch synthase [Deltaproteobacteria bacterium]
MKKNRPFQSRHNPRILIVTPEITYLPKGMGNMANHLKAKAGGLADVSASLVSALFDLGADVHVTLPHYRRMFNIDIGRFINGELRSYKKVLPESRIHLAQDRIFYYREEIYSNYYTESHKVALAFQREVINNIIPAVNPDLIHCNDWMTGLIPAMSRRMGIPCLFTVHNIHTQELTLENIENSGIDAAEFWAYLYYKRAPYSYEETRWSNPVDFLASGIFAAHFVNTVSPTFLEEICQGRHAVVPDNVRSELSSKKDSGCAFGILNSPDPSFNPQTDELLEYRYSAKTHVEGKKKNKLFMQERLGIKRDGSAPVFFWPSRLDPFQKGCQLLTDIFYQVISSYWKDNLQIVVVTGGAYMNVFGDIVRFHGFHERVALCDFDEQLSHLCYAASDFILMPSLFEPCGLPQMISSMYGSLPVVHDTGGLHDTVSHLDVESNSGNGFVFDVYDSKGLLWAIDRAMDFYHLPVKTRAAQISRVMNESALRFNPSVTARQYFDLYEKMLKRPIINTY